MSESSAAKTLKPVGCVPESEQGPEVGDRVVHKYARWLGCGVVVRRARCGGWRVKWDDPARRMHPSNKSTSQAATENLEVVLRREPKCS